MLNTKLKILDLGCGNNKVPNAIGLDNVLLPEVDIVHDLMDFPYPFEKDSFDKIYLRHVIEHFNVNKINFILKNIIRNQFYRLSSFPIYI